MSSPETPETPKTAETLASIEQLFRRFRDDGDPDALAALFDQTAPRLLLLAAHVTPDPAAAEDLLQETFLQAMQDAQQWDPDRPLLPWLGVILRHRAIDLARRLRVRRSAASRAQVAEIEAAGRTATDPHDAAAAGELLEQVQRALDALRPPYREALVLRIVHGMQPTAIAHALGRPPATVRVQLKRGLEVLRGALPTALPTALSATLAMLLSERGFAATRATVLAAAGAASEVSVVLPAARGLRRAGWLVASVVAALALAVGAYSWFTPASPVPSSSSASAIVADEALRTAGGGTPPSSLDPSTRVQLPPEALPTAPTTLRGRIVRAAAGTPLPGGHVEVRFGRGRFVTDDPTFRNWPDPVETMAAADGTFAITFLTAPETGVALELRAPGHAPVEASWPSLKAGIDVDLGDIALLRGCPLQARVVNEAGEPVPGVVLEFERRSGGAAAENPLFPMWSSFETASDDDGGLAACMLPAPGVYGVGVSFRHPGWRVVRPTELVVDASPIVTDIVVARPGVEDSIVGRVVDARGNAIAGVTLCVEPQMLELGNATSGPDGTFWLPLDVPQQQLPLHLPARERAFTLLEPERSYARGATDVEVRVQQQPTFDVPIQVLDARDGRPVTAYGLRREIDYWVDELRLSIPPDQIYRPAPAEPRPDGRALVRGLHPGRYRLCVFPADEALATAYLVPFEVAVTGAELVRIELGGFAPLRVVVHDEAGQPLPGVEVRLAHTMATGGEYSALFSVEQFARGVGGGRNTAVALQTGHTDADGVVVLRAPVNERRLGLQVQGPRVRWRRLDLDAVPAAGREQRLVVPTLARVHGRVGPAAVLARIGPPPAVLREAAMVRDEDSDLLASCPRVVLIGEGPDGEAGGSAPLLPDGTFTIDAAAPGSYRLELRLEWAMNAGFYTDESLILGTVRDLRAGEVRELEVDATHAMPARVRGSVFVDGAPWTRGQFGFLAVGGGEARDADRNPELFRIDLGPDGTFDRVQRPGRYLPCVVWDEHGGEQMLVAQQRCELLPGAEQTRRFSFEHRVLRVAVTRADGSAAKGAALRALAIDFPEARRWLPGSCQVGDDGILVLDPAPPGRVQFFEGGDAGALLGEFVAGALPISEVQLRLPR